MRQPKFRGFNLETNKWHYGHGWFITDYTEEYKQEKGIEDAAILYTDGSPIECVLSSMGEVTGITDENDVEIYEGDIIKFIMRQHDGDFIGTVEFGDGMFRVSLTDDDAKNTNVAYEDFTYYNALKFEVIDNIFNQTALK